MSIFRLHVGLGLVCDVYKITIKARLLVRYLWDISLVSGNEKRREDNNRRGVEVSGKRLGMVGCIKSWLFYRKKGCYAGTSVHNDDVDDYMVVVAAAVVNLR